MNVRHAMRKITGQRRPDDEGAVLDAASVRDRTDAGVRHDIAQRIHDEVLSTLAAVQQDLIELRDAGRCEVTGPLELLEDASRSLRSIISGQHPATVDAGDLVDIVESAARTALGRSGLQLRVSVASGVAECDRDLLVAAVRELARNAALHARATTLEIDVRRDGGQVRLDVADDGVGADLSTIHDAGTRGHLGIASLRRRVVDGGGTMRFHSSSTGGLHVEVRIADAAGARTDHCGPADQALDRTA